MKKLLFLFAFPFAFTACNDDDNTSIEENVPFETVYQNTTNGNGNIAPYFNAFNSQQELNAWNNTITEATGYVFPATSIDFNTKTVIVLYGPIQSSGSQLNVVSVKKTGGMMKVKYKIELNAASVISQPFHYISVPKTSLPIYYEQI